VRVVPTLALTKDASKDPMWLRLRQIYEQLAIAFNGRVSLGQTTQQSSGTSVPADNMDAASVLATVNVAANTDFVLTHNLGRLPSGYVVVGASAAYGCVYNGVTAWTTTQIYLRFTSAYNAGIKFLIW